MTQTVRLNKKSQEILEILRKEVRIKTEYNIGKDNLYQEIKKELSNTEIIEHALGTFYYILKGEYYNEHESKNKAGNRSEDLS